MADITTVNPTTGEDIKEYNYMTNDEVNKIVDASHEAFLEWRKKSHEERAKVIKSIGDTLVKYKEELSKLMTEERGKLYDQSLSEVDLCKAICDYTAEKGVTALADDERDIENMKKGIVTYQPIGVIYGMQPWNFPAYQVFRYAIANLMAGNSVLLKHAANVTGSGLLIEKIFHESDLPNDLFRTILIDHDQSEKLIGNDKVRGVTLTGSDGAGKIVGQQAAKVLKKVVLELGSNDAFIVLEDADLDLAVETCTQARLINNGETCVAAKRFIVVDSLYDEFRDRIVEKFSNSKAGDPMDDSSDIGPLARKDLQEKLHEQVEESVKKGATISVGGKLPEGKGNFYPATILENVSEGQPAYDDELFGPVASLIRAKDQDDAMRIANDSRYGLGGAIFSKDEDKAIRLAREQFDTGMVYINGYGLANPALPFGGVKNSGHGREHGGFGIKEFVNIKGLHVHSN
ncbi:MAG: NAD-dependent succinate-semialdehyde dehydrogenase [Psychrobacter sp.]|jgi:succinate-semialdehyde dehydrogenase/glutarate-semialdehyde dehydrogenase|uniref:NAD-dependent succinate-semialdehyde dehydrogenase n=1 Tax=Psychrobacter submarinus TaxID=154108 RepID=UPI000C643C8E|nr:NAD-dependent succinate-semialdehyde dehydrogenase [uncultured Psychrobacter sp.]MAE40497.1 succinate-semialdehyde dehydrogenase [Psychrobacter sp.]HAM60439.1 succinate-semialdehyde dehydrogenase [Psychrobacter sp.]|tara:strand:- start:500 stop:1879 length:1380 start_codon:yes stop_codon:yes gene_type:complete